MSTQSRLSDLRAAQGPLIVITDGGSSAGLNVNGARVQFVGPTVTAPSGPIVSAYSQDTSAVTTIMGQNQIGNSVKAASIEVTDWLNVTTVAGGFSDITAGSGSPGSATANFTTMTPANLNLSSGGFRDDVVWGGATLNVTTPETGTVNTNLNIIDNVNFGTSTSANITGTFTGFTGSLSTLNGNAGVFSPNATANISSPNLSSFTSTISGCQGSIINITGCALSATSVNYILAQLVALSPTVGSFDLSGGTSASPTGQGITDAATLVSNGCTVTTN